MSNEGAKKCLKILDKADGHIDMHISKKLDIIDIYAVYPNLIKQDDHDSEVSPVFPVIVNRILNKIPCYNSKLGWCLSTPLFAINSYVVCPWSFIFFLMGIIGAYNTNCLIVILCLLIIMLSGERKITTQLLGSLLLFLIGFLLGKMCFK